MMGKAIKQIVLDAIQKNFRRIRIAKRKHLLTNQLATIRALKNQRVINFGNYKLNEAAKPG